MILMSSKQEWFGNIRGDILAGIVVALALIPEAIAFSIIAGVDPKVGLYASFCIAAVIAFVGGRAGMISAATAIKIVKPKGRGSLTSPADVWGGMAGCAMIGQSVINIKSGGRGRLSTLIAGVLLLIMVVFMSDLIRIIPMAALVAVMIMVSIGTFNWASIKGLKTLPLSTNVVMLSTVFVVVGTHNLALGVFTGVLLASLFFANKISHFMYWEKSYEETSSTRVYKFIGQIFFNSADRFADAFDYKEDVKNVIIDVTRAHFWDITAVYALDKAVIKLRNMGKEVEVIGQNEATRTIIDRFGIHDKPAEIEKVMGGH